LNAVISAPDVYVTAFAHAESVGGKLGPAGNLSPWHRRTR